MPFAASLRLPGAAALLILAAAGMRGAEPSDAELWSGAEARIEKHRKADATIAVVDAAGHALPGAEVAVEQTRHAFLFGCNIFAWDGIPDPELQATYRRRFADLMNYATLPFYWPSYEPDRGRPMHERTEGVARWCREQGMQTKGHPLAWNFADPAWLPEDPDEIHRLQLARIDDCVRHFAGRIDRWDVVNEATHYDRDEFAKHGGRKHTAMWKKFGQVEFTRECFAQARRANPRATLLINDYRTDPPYERLIEKLVDQQGKRLYDVIGIQSHMHGGPWSNRNIWDVCQRYARFGVPLHFTETTILSGQLAWDKPKGSDWPSTAEGEAFQARETARFYTMLFSHPAVEAITWWDFADLHAWKGAPAGFLRRDLTAKPVYEELQRRIKGSWWSKAKLPPTGADGTAAFRGFLGEYKVVVSVQGKPPVEARAELKRGAANRWVVKVP